MTSQERAQHERTVANAPQSHRTQELSAMDNPDIPVILGLILAVIALTITTVTKRK